MEIVERKLSFDDNNLVAFLTYNEELLKVIEPRFSSTIVLRGNNVIIKGEGEEIDVIEKVLKEMAYIYKKNNTLEQQDLSTILNLLEIRPSRDPSSAGYFKDNIIYYGVKDVVRAKTQRQIDYCRKVLNNDVVFSIGPAGTGKTFLAVAMALNALRNNEVGRVIISRPAVEAGESLGFLPGDMKDKIDPYLRPLTDALLFMLGADKMKTLMEKQIIEIIPLAYMRGRTLANSFIILDEAQNATITQMKMFLTRLGLNSKAVITGDITQVDLTGKDQSGLINARDILQNIKGIEFVFFENKDVVRHKLVAEIIRAYEKQQESRRKKLQDKTADEEGQLKNNI